jgi:hypothetical protein
MASRPFSSSRMRKASSRSSSQLLGEKESSGRRKIELIQEAHAFGSEQIAALGQLEPVLGAKEPMNAIAHHRAMPHKETKLAQHLFNLSGGLPADVHPRNETAAQQIGQNVGIDLVVLICASAMIRVLNALANTMSSRGMASSRISNRSNNRFQPRLCRSLPAAGPRLNLGVGRHEWL